MYIRRKKLYITTTIYAKMINNTHLNTTSPLPSKKNVTCE